MSLRTKLVLALSLLAAAAAVAIGTFSYNATQSQLQSETDASLDQATRELFSCLLYTSPSPRDGLLSRMPSSA